MYDPCLKQFAKVSPSSLSPTEAHPLPFSAVDVLADMYRVSAHPTESQKTSVDRLTLPFVLCAVEAVFDRAAWEPLGKLELHAKRKCKGHFLILWLSQGACFGREP